MPDLGDYTGPVLLAYAFSLTALVAIVVLSVWRSRRVRRDLEEVERRRGEAQ